ncbi:hypothetical protein DRN67_04420 [Candidatus Micrarchaeota archaeon]|nr:MAG: hypothetical protein DRN67_04420 [Candidatus Micrarchaeota archaeon]
MVKKRKGSEPAASSKGGIKIAFSSVGKDFHLEVRGGKLDECERTFERLFRKVRGGSKGEETHYG